MMKKNLYDLLGVLPVLTMVLCFGLPDGFVNGQDPLEFQYSISGADVDYASSNPSAFGFHSTISIHQTLGEAAETGGFQVGVGIDQELLLITEAECLLTGPSGETPLFCEAQILPHGFNMGVVYDAMGVWTVSYEIETEVITVICNLQDGVLTGATSPAVTSLAFETIGDPAIANLVVVNGGSISVTTTIDGPVTLIPHDGAPLIRGDASQDGSLDLADGVGILQYLFIGVAADCLDALDANDSGNVSITDAIRVLCALYCSGSPPPESPFPGCGFDSTADPLGCLSYPGCP